MARYTERYRQGLVESGIRGKECLGKYNCKISCILISLWYHWSEYKNTYRQRKLSLYYPIYSLFIPIKGVVFSLYVCIFVLVLIIIDAYTSFLTIQLILQLYFLVTIPMNFALYSSNILPASHIVPGSWHNPAAISRLLLQHFIQSRANFGIG